MSVFGLAELDLAEFVSVYVSLSDVIYVWIYCEKRDSCKRILFGYL